MAAPAVLEKLSEAETLDDKIQYYKDTLGDLSGVRVLFNQILVAVYVGGKYIPGTRILRSHGNIKEDIFQSVSGLVIKMGSAAFDKYSPVEVGDWVTFTPGDGKRIQINGIDCRVIEDTRILMVIDDPEIITHRQ